MTKCIIHSGKRSAEVVALGVYHRGDGSKRTSVDRCIPRVFRCFREFGIWVQLTVSLARLLGLVALVSAWLGLVSDLN
jgi:hypothetical protein